MKRIEGGRGDDGEDFFAANKYIPGMKIYQFRGGAAGPLAGLIGCPLMLVFSVFFVGIAAAAGLIAMIAGRKSFGISGGPGGEPIAPGRHVPDLYVDDFDPGEDIIDIEVDRD